MRCSKCLVSDFHKCTRSSTSRCHLRSLLRCWTAFAALLLVRNGFGLRPVLLLKVNAFRVKLKELIVVRSCTSFHHICVDSLLLFNRILSHALVSVQSLVQLITRKCLKICMSSLCKQAKEEEKEEEEKGTDRSWEDAWILPSVSSKFFPITTVMMWSA